MIATGPDTLTVRPSAASALDWDAFARRCAASFRSSYHAARAWQFEYHWRFRLRRLDVFYGDAKVGQCAVGVGKRVSVFSDGVQLLPGHAHRWADAAAAVLRRLGSATYVYGSEWSLEPPRESALTTLAGVAVDDVSPTSVQVIDFRRWPTFDAYRRATSTNVRRNVKKAEKAYPSLTLSVRPGVGHPVAFARSVMLRRALFQRKGVDRSTAGMLLRSAARLASLRRYSHTAYLDADGTLLSSYVGITFGELHAYLEGASDPNGKGASWYLLMAMIERAFVESNGQGRLLMGSDDGTQAGVDAWEGLRRSREQACAEPFPTSVVRFRYDVGRADDDMEHTRQIDVPLKATPSLTITGAVRPDEKPTRGSPGRPTVATGEPT